ncbi:MAG: thiamine-phosphate kinase [Methanobacteriaceae archaeon]
MPSNKLKISDIGEKRLVKRLLSRSQRSIPNSPFFNSFFDNISLKSLEDDAALLPIGDQYLVITSDLLFEPSHFPPGMSTMEMGMKSVVVNLSDLAAMGARPLGIIMSMGLPPDLLLEDFDLMVEGLLRACNDYDIALLGGDTNQADEITLCGTALGIVDKDKVLLKCGAQDGDLVAVTGVLGSAAGGFEVLLGGESLFVNLNSQEKYEIIKHALQPEARIKEGIALSESKVTSSTDITDGLVSEIGEIMASSEHEIGIRFYEDKIPISPILDEVAQISGKSVEEMALYYGEDFELLFTIKPQDFISLQEKCEVHSIGEVTSTGRIEMVDKEGNTKILVARGYEHLHTS